MSRRPTRFLAIVALMAVFATACGSGQASSDAGPTATQVTLGLPKASPVFAPFYYAARSDVCSRAGVKLDLKILSPSSSVAALAGGSVDLIVGSTQVPLAAMKNTADMAFIADVGSPPGEGIYGVPEVKSITDLKGKIIAGSTPGGPTDEIPGLMLKQAGIGPQDYQTVYLQTLAAQQAALAAGKAHAMLIAPPLSDTMTKAGVHLVQSLEDAGLTYTFTDYLVGQKGWVHDHPDAVQAVMKCIAGSITAARGDLPGAVAAMSTYLPNDPSYAEQATPINIKGAQIRAVDQAVLAKILVQFGDGVSQGQADQAAGAMVDNGPITQAGVDVSPAP